MGAKGTGPSVLRTADISKIDIKSNFESEKKSDPFLSFSERSDFRKNEKKLVGFLKLFQIFFQKISSLKIIY